jgi:ABC-type ATPase involved in cell division
VLLADEPTGNPDESIRDEIIALMGQLWRDEYPWACAGVSHAGQVTRGK